MPAAAAPNASQLRQQNLAMRQLVLQYAIEEIQPIYSTSFTTGPGTVINIPVRNVGLIKRFIVEVAATVSGSAGPTHTLTKLGLANFFSQIVLTDLSNQTRINTTGWHLTALASAKYRQPFGSAITALDTPFGYGNNYQKTQVAPATITAAAGSNNVFGMFEIPLAYSDDDLRGAIYANVVNATMNLQLTVNPNLLVASTVTDAVLSMYQSSTTTVATLPSFTVTVYQVYLDQIPQGNQGPVLPILDLSTAYLINNTVVSSLVQNQDNPIPYANFRDFLSTTLIYDNTGVLNAGSDINYFTIQTANYTNMIKYDPAVASLLARQRMQDDFPTGMYYFDHRRKPISTVQYGNQQLIVNPSAVTGAGSSFLMGYESMALINQITQAGSLYGN